MTEHEEIVNIGDTDENADWIKTPENRKTEKEIHDKLAEEQEKEGEQEEESE